MPCVLPNDADRPNLPAIFTGGCHCGAVRFRVTLRRFRASECNCSICTKKGFLHLIVPHEDFELASDERSLTTYEFNTRTAKHHFCKTCGVHAYYVPRSHPEGFSVNARCLDEAKLDWFELERFDGQNWEAHVAKLQ
jgi:hypothetical protein